MLILLFQIGLGLNAFDALVLRLAEILMPQSGKRIPLVDFQWAFVVIGVIALLAVIDFFTLDANAGSEVRQRPPGRTLTSRNAEISRICRQST